MSNSINIKCSSMCIVFSFSFPILPSPCCCRLLTLFKDVLHVCCSPRYECVCPCVVMCFPVTDFKAVQNPSGVRNPGAEYRWRDHRDILVLTDLPLTLFILFLVSHLSLCLLCIFFKRTNFLCLYLCFFFFFLSQMPL